nr:uncharacterized protein LOC109185694 [Ipomoea batatas]
MVAEVSSRGCPRPWWSRLSSSTPVWWLLFHHFSLMFSVFPAVLDGFWVARGLAECVSRRWPKWDPLPPNWKFILKRAETVKVRRVIERAFWCKPEKGVGSGVCSEGGTLQQLIDQMMADCRRWCCMKRPWQVVVESNDERVLERVGRLEVFITSRCGEGVNCVVGYLVDKMEGWNVIYAKLNALPRSFRIQLDLGGLPHFCWGPEAEFR